MTRLRLALIASVALCACRLDVNVSRPEGGVVDVPGSGGAPSDGASPADGTGGAGGAPGAGGQPGTGGGTGGGGVAGTGGAVGTSGTGFTTFSYVGDGTDDRPITGLGFRPDLVLLHAAGNVAGCLRTSTMTGDLTRPQDDRLVANLVQSLDADGFTVGNDNRVNQAGVTYVGSAWLAGAGRLFVGSYVGNLTPRSIDVVGSLPALVIVIPDDAMEISYRLNTMTETYGLSNGANWPSNIASLDASGFTIGTSGMINGSGVVYHYAAFAASNPALRTGSFVGDGTDNRVIPGIAITPALALVQIETASAYAPQLRVAAIPPGTDASFELGALWQANMIQALLVDGLQLGSDPHVNAPGKQGHWFVYGR